MSPCPLVPSDAEACLDRGGSATSSSQTNAAFRPESKPLQPVLRLPCDGYARPREPMEQPFLPSIHLDSGTPSTNHRVSRIVGTSAKRAWRQASRSFFVVPFRLELPTSSTCTLKPSFQDWFSCLIFPAHLAIALNMAMMIPTPRIEPIDVEASRIGNNGPYAARRMDLANASMGQLGTDDGDQD